MKKLQHDQFRKTFRKVVKGLPLTDDEYTSTLTYYHKYYLSMVLGNIKKQFEQPKESLAVVAKDMKKDSHNYEKELYNISYIVPKHVAVASYYRDEKKKRSKT